MTSELVRVTFRFPSALAPAANRIAIVGTFNGWSPKVHHLTKTPEDGWVIKIFLPPGRTVYYFDVDGACWLDPNDEGRIPNGWGSEYSVRYIQKSDANLLIRRGHTQLAHRA